MAKSGTAMKRLAKEMRDIRSEPLAGISLTPILEDSPFEWKATLDGPEGSPYEGGRFAVSVQCAQDYPFTAPKLTFKTKIYHCNIASTGAICLDVLKNNWSPALSLQKVMLSLSSLLTDPNPNDPLVGSIAQEYLKDRRKHDATAREWTARFATPIPKKAATSSSSATAESSRKGKDKAAPAPPPPKPARPQSKKEVIVIDD